ncbi:GbsR/MarR family transcriptional regulator [Streptomyces apocyni]|uniref:GbsR/MarR family transcriptional regulator n=1 Tax=Streptomyces apocyni TaxID=2654677 RepID=UPI001E5B014C|nr:MarR family transcriptional regulator [Streptomyces apocyni]
MGNADAIGERNEQDVAAFIERFAAELTEAGIPRMPSRVFACLLVEEGGALTSAELSDRLRISAAAVSGAVRYLAQISLVSREREPGSRRERYRLHNHVWFESMTRRDQILDRWQRVLEEGVSVVGGDTQAGRRLAESAEFFDFLKHELHDVLARWNARVASRSAST